MREARARIGILGLLFGNKSLSFDALFDEGEIEGAYEEDGDTKHVEGKLDKIDLARLGIADALLSLPAKGTLEGEFDLSVGKEASDTGGTATLLLKQLTVGDGQAKLKMAGMGGLTIDPIEAGDVTLELDVKSGVGQIKKLTTNGRDIELNGSGEIRFANPFARSRLDLLLTIKFTDAYKNKTPRTKAMFALLDGSAMPQVRSATTPDGALAYRITGLVATPRALPAGRSAPRTGGPRNTPAKPAGGSRPDDDTE